jgi:hypothetical protein
MIDSTIGWLLDVTIEQNSAILWIKTGDGKILRLRDSYQPNFYVLPKNENAGADLFYTLSQQPKITRVDWQSKLTDIFDHNKERMKKLLCMYLESIYYYKIFLKRLENTLSATLEE